MKKLALLTLFLCLSFTDFAAAETENWCGTYFEEGNRGYIRLARDDFGIGSSGCSWDDYNKRAEKSGTANIALEFSKKRSGLNKWRKFNNHLIEVRGKFRNGYISNPRFIRDRGI